MFKLFLLFTYNFLRIMLFAKFLIFFVCIIVATNAAIESEALTTGQALTIIASIILALLLALTFTKTKEE